MLQRRTADERPFIRNLDGLDDRQYVLMPIGEIAPKLFHGAGFRPTLVQPITALDGRGNVQQRTLPQRIGDDLAGRSHPGRKDLLSESDRYTLDRYNRAPCHEPREGRAAF